MDYSRRDPRADSEVPDVLGCVHRGLDGNRAFVYGGNIFAHGAFGFVRRTHSIFLGETDENYVLNVPARSSCN
jgi:hypothetical protein